MRIVCLTSNAYHNCLVPFAHYWNRFAGAEHRVTVACYDAPLPDLPDNFSPIRLGNQADYTWSEGLARLLSRTDNSPLLLMLEDYFLIDPADWTAIQQAERAMLLNWNLAKFDLSDDRLKAPHHPDGTSRRVILSDDDAPFQLSLQAALWKPDFLYRWLDRGENAWQFEKHGTGRLIAARRQGVETALIAGYRDPPLIYANAVGGAGGKPGKIERKHMPDWMWQECLERGWADG